MTYQQIGAFPHKPCCHVGERAGCLHCANDARVREDQGKSGTIKTSDGGR